jgi:mRNA interferase HigB
MRVFSQAALRRFWALPGHEDSEAPLRSWYKNVGRGNVSWKNFADVKAAYGSASIFKHCVIFNIAGNKYRLVTRIKYPYWIYIVQVLTHRDYDKGLWKGACRCADQFKTRPQNGKAAERG